MDSSNGTANYKLKAIKAAIENGTLTKQEINRRLNYAISEEYKKEPVSRDTQFILACEKLLHEMYTGKAYVSRKEECQRALLRKIESKAENNTKNISKTAWRVVIAACAVLIVVTAIEVLLYREWLQGSSTGNEQQYIVSGNDNGLNALPNGIADTPLAIQSIQTTDFEEVKHVLGFSPKIPDVHLQNWSLEYYSVVVFPSNTTFSATYVNSTYENALLFSIKYYTNIENAQNWIEQNKQEEIIHIGKKEVYFAENLNNSVCVWSHDSTCYTLFGPLSQNQLIPIIESI